MKTKEITIETLLNEIDEAEKKCLEMLVKLRKQRAELTADEIVEFTVSTIHKDKKTAIFNQLSRIDEKITINELEQQWRKSAQATTNGWFGTVKILGLKKKATPSRLNKIANLGGTITVDTIHKMDIPAPDKWWDSNLELVVPNK